MGPKTPLLKTRVLKSTMGRSNKTMTAILLVALVGTQVNALWKVRKRSQRGRSGSTPSSSSTGAKSQSGGIFSSVGKFFSSFGWRSTKSLSPGLTTLDKELADSEAAIRANGRLEAAEGRRGGPARSSPRSRARSESGVFPDVDETAFALRLKLQDEKSRDARAQKGTTCYYAKA